MCPPATALTTMLFPTTVCVSLIYKAKEVHGSFNVIGPVSSIGRSIIRLHGLVGVGMPMLEKVCHCSSKL